MFGKRFWLAAFFGVVACGVSFYLITFLGLLIELFRGPMNPAITPELDNVLNQIVMPFSVLLGVVTFLVTFLRLGKRRIHSSLEQ
ncbi:MAG: hypothetical protein ACE14M_15630 [Terriglobales bacterium]